MGVLNLELDRLAARCFGFVICASVSDSRSVRDSPFVSAAIVLVMDAEHVRSRVFRELMVDHTCSC